MVPDEHDTIAAPASAAGPGGRGVVRLSGPKVFEVLAAITQDAAPQCPATARFVPGVAIEIELAGRALSLPVDVFVWPDERSYTRQPTIELHTPANRLVVDAVVRACCAGGARLAQPGEFTLRAFLSGRIDLTQAEAVLGVIDANNEAALADALGRLAGGLSTPLHGLRDGLTQLLAELEAGLDFVDEEDVRFIEPEELVRRLTDAAATVRRATEQANQRGSDGALPVVALAGPPNAGKSRLFNTLRARYATDQGADALVSATAGTTRDTLTATLAYNNVRFQVVDTAGVGSTPKDAIDAVATDHTALSVGNASLVLRCTAAGIAAVDRSEERSDERSGDELSVVTKADLLHTKRLSSGSIVTSAVTGEGVELLMQAVVERLATAEAATHAQIAAGASARCREALAAARRSLENALDLAAGPAASDELVAEELRQSLTALGDVVGATTTDDLLDRIFGQFCIGK